MNLSQRSITRRKSTPAPMRPSTIQFEILFDAEEPGEPARLLPLVRDDGSAQWWFAREPLTVADIDRSFEHGLLRGNPRRLYLVVDEPPQGAGNGLDYWFEMLRVAPEIWHGVSATAEVIGAIEGLRRLVGVIVTARQWWAERGGDLDKYEQLFAVARTTEQAAKLLAVDEDMVGPIASFMGLEEGSNGYWRVSNRPDDRQFRELPKVAHLAAEMHLRASSLRQGLAEILALPVGNRVEQAEAKFRALEYRATQLESQPSYSITGGSGSGIEGMFDVVRFRGVDVPRTLGSVSGEPDGFIVAVDPAGRVVSDAQGRTIRFKDIDRAAEFIVDNAREG